MVFNPTILLNRTSIMLTVSVLSSPSILPVKRLRDRRFNQPESCRERGAREAIQRDWSGMCKRLITVWHHLQRSPSPSKPQPDSLPDPKTAPIPPSPLSKISRVDGGWIELCWMGRFCSTHHPKRDVQSREALGTLDRHQFGLVCSSR